MRQATDFRGRSRKSCGSAKHLRLRSRCAVKTSPIARTMSEPKVGTPFALRSDMDAIRTELAAERRVLDDLFCHLSHAIDAGRHDVLQLTWCELEHRLLSRMDVEEQFLLPFVEASHQADVRRARVVHQRIRGLVADLGIAIELRTVHQAAVTELIHVLHQQAEREDGKLYQVAFERASVVVQHRMAVMLRAAVRSAHEAALRTSASRSGSHAAVRA